MRCLLLCWGALVATVPIAEAAIAADWRLVAKPKEGTIYVDAQSIVPKDGLRRAWDKWEYGEDQPGFPDSGIKSFRVSKHLAYYNCGERTFAAAQVVYIDARGKSVGEITLDVSPESFSVVVPDSIAESQLSFVCTAKLRAKP